MNKFFSALACTVVLSFSPQLLANSSDGVPAALAKPSSDMAFDAQKLKQAISTTLGLNVTSAKKSEMPGLAEVITDQGLFYTSYDGQYFIQGKLFSLGANVTNLTESSLAQVRIDGMTKFKDDMIVYPAKDEKHVITVFTDITCGYCRKMHTQMDAYNELGITVRYLAYPRSGVMDRNGNFTQGYSDLRSIWCNEDPATAMTRAKAGSGVAQRICDSPIEGEFDFGRQVGVNSTPTIMLANGHIFPGYRAPNDLIQILESM